MKIIPNKRFYRVFTDNPSIFATEYEDRIFNISTINIKPVREMIESNLPETSRLGLCNTQWTWDYIYFGKNFKRTLIYIPKTELIKNDIGQILKAYNLNGLLVKVIETDKNTTLSRGKNVNYKIEKYFNDYFILFFLK